MRTTPPPKPDVDKLAAAIEYCFCSPNESDRNFEPANVVDGLFYIGRAIHRLADVLEGKEE